MIARATQGTISVQEYLAQEEFSRIKHEYVRGHIYAMAGGTLARDRIANEIRTILNIHLGQGPCAVDGPDMRVRVALDVSYYPDALVTCEDPLDDAVEVLMPRLIVEVLSDSTATDDRGDKFADYRTLSSLEEYLLVDSRRRSVERYRRAGPGHWTYQSYDADADLTLESIGLTCPVAAFYRRTQL